MKTRLLLLYLLLCILKVQGQDTYLNIVSTDGTESKVILSDIRNLTFPDTDNFYLNHQNGTSYIFQTTTVRKLMFTTVSGIQESAKENCISIYPNPTKNYFYIKNESGDNMDIAIYSVSGTELANLQKISPSQSIDVSALPKGMYLVKVNGQTFKLLKK